MTNNKATAMFTCLGVEMLWRDDQREHNSGNHIIEQKENGKKTNRYLVTHKQQTILICDKNGKYLLFQQSEVFPAFHSKLII